MSRVDEQGRKGYEGARGHGRGYECGDKGRRSDEASGEKAGYAIGDHPRRAAMGKEWRGVTRMEEEERVT